jgi:hypothetical protein
MQLKPESKLRSKKIWKRKKTSQTKPEIVEQKQLERKNIKSKVDEKYMIKVLYLKKYPQVASD